MKAHDFEIDLIMQTHHRARVRAFTRREAELVAIRRLLGGDHRQINTQLQCRISVIREDSPDASRQRPESD